MSNFPVHVAIIMDGNGRWARRAGKKRTYGHYVGSRVVEKVVKKASEIGIRYLTLYAFSTENWKRPSSEIRFITSMLRIYMIRSEEQFVKNNIQFKVIGNVSVYDDDTRKLIISLQQRTERNKGMRLTLAINYGSKKEITEAVRRIVWNVKGGNLSIKDIDENLVSSYLYTADMPEVDLLIRTGFEKRLSNFLLWQSAYAELIFLDKYWPEFTVNDLLNAIEEFRKRDRRFGGL